MTERSLASVEFAIVEHADHPPALDHRNLLINAGIVLILVDAQSTIRFCTPAAASLFELSANSLERSLPDIQAFTNDGMLAQDVGIVLRGREPVQREVEAYDGRWFLRRIEPYRDARLGNGATIVFADVTHRARALAELRSAKRQAELASAATLRQLAAACHDLRQPMHTLGLIGGVLSQSVDDALVKRLTGQMDSTLLAMSGLLNSLHNSCRANAGALQPDVRPFSVGTVLQTLQQEFRYHAEAYGMDLRVVQSTLRLNSDPALFEQIIRSILEHIRQAHPGKIVLGCRHGHDSIRIEFWCAREPASRAKAQAAAGEGRSALPLGLDLAKRLVDLLGFRLSHATRSGRPIHVVRIPAKFVLGNVAAADNGEPAAEASPEQHAVLPVGTTFGSDADPAQSVVVHVVDDDADVRDTVRQMLHDSIGAIEAHESAEAFLAAYAPSANACLLLDENLTGMSGIDLIRRLNEMDCRPPTIMISGRGDIGVAVEAMRLGAVDFVEKPLHREKLLAAIESAIIQSRQFERDREERQKILARIARLTPRQKQVMQLMLDGKSSKTIAAHLFMSRRTVESHRATIMAKMAAKSLPELAAMVSLTKASAANQ